ncbi:MAG TPA: porin [Terriglobales bacterium]|nr:porin [Terriglobales bacterium]
MKATLLGSSVLLATGMLAGTAQAADGIKLHLGGFFRTAFNATIDDNGQNDLGHDRDATGVFSDAEVYFIGKTTLDNGLTVGARVELEGEQQTGDQIDAAFIYFQGGFGEVRIGSLKGAFSQLCVSPVGGTTNFSAFQTTDEVLTNAYAGSKRTDTVCNSVDGWDPGQADKSQKIVYISPNYGGFQLGLSWSPNGAHESGSVSNGHTVMPANAPGDQKNIIDAYLAYKHDFDGWGLQAGAGGSWAPEIVRPTATQEKGQSYQTGLNLTFGQFAVGSTFAYEVNGQGKNRDYWFTGIGAAYTFDAYMVGLQYAYTSGDITAEHINRHINHIALNGNYFMGPGISLDATLQYAWANGDQGDAANGGYHSYSFGLGTAFNF